MLIECDRSKFRAPAEIKRVNSECDRKSRAIEIFNVECYLVARHYPCRNNSFSK